MDKKSYGDMIWSVVGGFAGALPLTAAGVALCTTIIGMPAGVQCLKLAKEIVTVE